jgi:excisionase family DNA binding protein
MTGGPQNQRNSGGLPPERLLTPEDPAKLLGVPPRMVRRLVSERRLGFIKVGRYVRISIEQVETFVNENEKPPVRRWPQRGAGPGRA